MDSTSERFPSCSASPQSVYIVLGNGLLMNSAAWKRRLRLKATESDGGSKGTDVTVKRLFNSVISTAPDRMRQVGCCLKAPSWPFPSTGFKLVSVVDFQKSTWFVRPEKLPSLSWTGRTKRAFLSVSLKWLLCLPPATPQTTCLIRGPALECVTPS